MAAVLTNDKGNTDKLVKYINECRDMSIEILPPDVNTSRLDFTVDGERIRFGLSAIKNVGEGAIRAILEARGDCGPFKSLHQLCECVDMRQVNKRVLEALVQSGALDSLGARRSQLEVAIDPALEYGQKRRADREAGQTSLFGGDDPGAEAEAVADALPDVPEWDEKTRLTHEKATLGFYITGHPLESHRALLEEFATQSSATLGGAESGSTVAVGGVIGALRRRKSRKGDWWASMRLEDMEGQVEVLVFPKCYQTCQEQLNDDLAVMVVGRLDIDGDRVRLIADSLCPMEKLREQQVEAVQVRLDAADLDDALVQRLLDTVEEHRGSAKLFFEVARPGAYRLIARAESSLGVRPSTTFTEMLESVVGPDRVRYQSRGMITEQTRSRGWRSKRPAPEA